ncbi:thyroid receptor-interacting protein 6 [Synchiropus splendidus]|uniref:thyroid receptor-interacting protein 6 n=1 Tax=Synchiropus splendidus TaxID=270530 RepID=UPI00237DB308|nr:thyroid receptor-interacting protein 6 [Synchiropus splendidus]XP_053715346.1 thyroid receptor-interacting protein 6 [Synchiropus splendidus]XP_053715347.1 thyroid receptor-interacting protein 6 [Synchiropus splendidus]
MSGPTWLPPRTLDSPERAVPQMSHVTGSAIYRAPNKKAASDFPPKYSNYEQNGGVGGVALRYMATGPRAGGSVHHPSSDHYYSPPHGPKEDRNWSPHMDSYELMHRGPGKAVGHPSKIDADIDSLTSMLADLDSHPHESSTQLYDNVPYNKYLSEDQYKSAHQNPAPSQSRPSMDYPPHPRSQYYPAPLYHSDHHSSQYSSAPHQDYYSPSPPAPKPYPQPVPASYTTASTPTGPRFTVQVKTAQPVTYSQTGRQAEQAYTPPPPRQHVSRPPPQTSPQGWYPPQSSSQTQVMHPDVGCKGVGGRVNQVSVPKRGMESNPPVQSSAYQSSKVAASTKPEEELDRLTKKLVYDMNHPPAEDYFGRCARCGDNVVGDGNGCIAMEQVFHVECFTCITCHARLRGQPFYALDKKSYCETCYISTLERCSKCSKPILDRILRAMGKAYHPRCFTCIVCNCCLDGVPFTVDATSQIHCIDDFHRKYAPRCSVCGEPIMPEAGQEETVRIVALDRSFHVNCYVCEECGLLLSSEGEGRGCYPLDGHILCKSCSARRIQDLSAKISTDC